MIRLGLLVTDSSPLITLAAADALDCLTMPRLRVMIPDMVYLEVTQDMAKTGADVIVDWARRNRDQVQIVPTTVFAEFETVRMVNPAARSKGRGELATLEVLNAEIDRDPELEAVLLFEDADIRTRRFVLALPERVIALSTGDLLHELEAAGRIQSSDRVLDAAAEKQRNVERLRQPSADDEARRALRQHLHDGTDQREPDR